MYTEINKPRVDWASFIVVRSRDEAVMLEGLDATGSKWYIGDLYNIENRKPIKYEIKLDVKVK